MARDSEPTRLAIRLGLTAGGLRRAYNPRIGIEVTALVLNKGEHTLSKPSWCSADTRERSHLDQEGRSKLEELGDDEPILLSRRKRQLAL